MARRSENELYNLWRGDYLQCTACHNIIYMTPPAGIVYFRTIKAAYHDHITECMPLRRLLVTRRMNKPAPIRLLRCSGYGVYPDGSKCIGCPDCESKPAPTALEPIR
jgi:NAD-dependent dihydropyrimidine dehydrogenase PreA subunit